MSANEKEEGTVFNPGFDEKGLIPCITTSADTGVVLMFAWMNEEALKQTLATGEAHYWSRSREELWHKGATSGYVQKVVEMRTDCDQDCLWMSVRVDNEKEAACHTGRKTCFYRKVTADKNGNDVKLVFVESEKLFDPKKVYDS